MTVMIALPKHNKSSGTFSSTRRRKLWGTTFDTANEGESRSWALRFFREAPSGADPNPAIRSSGQKSRTSRTKGMVMTIGFEAKPRTNSRATREYRERLGRDAYHP